MSCPQRLQLLIADPEPAMRWQLRQLVADCVNPPCEIAAEAASAAEALHQLAQRRIDGVLLDARFCVSPASASGAQAASGAVLVQGLRGRADAPPLVVLAHEPAQALQAFEVEAVDCLLRPVRPARLQQALGRVARSLPVAMLETQRLAVAAARVPGMPGATDALVIQPGMQRWADGLNTPSPVLRVCAQQRLLHLPLAELRYLRATHKCVTVRTRERSYVVDDPLHELAERLGEAGLRIHRNTLVLRAAVRSLERRSGDAPQQLTWAVQLADVSQWLEVSRRRVTQVRQALGLG